MTNRILYEEIAIVDEFSKKEKEMFVKASTALHVVDLIGRQTHSMSGYVIIQMIWTEGDGSFGQNIWYKNTASLNDISEECEAIRSSITKMDKLKVEWRERIVGDYTDNTKSLDWYPS